MWALPHHTQRWLNKVKQNPPPQKINESDGSPRLKTPKHRHLQESDASHSFKTLHFYFVRAKHFCIFYVAFQYSSKLSPAFNLSSLHIYSLSRIGCFLPLFSHFSLFLSPSPSYWSRVMMFFLINFK